jgi:hypothetical protein
MRMTPLNHADRFVLGCDYGGGKLILARTYKPGLILPVLSCVVLSNYVIENLW